MSLHEHVLGEEERKLLVRLVEAIEALGERVEELEDQTCRLKDVFKEAQMILSDDQTAFAVYDHARQDFRP